MPNNKQSLRQQFRAKRTALTLDERAIASQSIVQHILTQPWFENNQHFAAYLAVNNEIDTTSLITSLWQQQKACYLPKITADNTLLFAHYTAYTVLLNNRFGIGEPSHDAPLYPVNNLDVIFMPLVAFDRQGHRLGTGAGYYDKTLQNIPTTFQVATRRLRSRAAECTDRYMSSEASRQQSRSLKGEGYTHKKRPLLVGLAYSLQQADNIPHDPWDINLDMVVTEQGVHSCVTG